MHNCCSVTLQNLCKIYKSSSLEMWLVLITLPKYRTVFIIQVLNTKHIFSVGVSTTFWNGGASTMLAKRWSWGMVAAITTSEFLNYRASYWGCICMCRATGRLCGQVKIRSRCKVCKLINVDSTDMLFIFPKLLAKGSRRLQGHFLLQERKWAPLCLNSLVIYKGLITG